MLSFDVPNTVRVNNVVTRSDIASRCPSTAKTILLHAPTLSVWSLPDSIKVVWHDMVPVKPRLDVFGGAECALFIERLT